MKVRAYYIKEDKVVDYFAKGISSVTEDDFYSKTVDVPDNSDMETLEKFARGDASKGFKFVKLEKI